MPKKKLKPHFGKLSIIYLVIIAVLIAADLLTKHLEVKYCWSSNGPVLGGLVNINYGVKNYGVAFGLNLGQIPVLIVTFLLLAVMVFAFIFMPDRYIILKISISLVIAGAIGNIVDRIALGYVRDWFGLWMFGNMAFCNFADFWIVIGAVLAIIDMLFIVEFAVFPLTKKAKAYQAARKEEEERKKAEEEGNKTSEFPEQKEITEIQPESEISTTEITEDNEDKNE